MLFSDERQHYPHPEVRKSQGGQRWGLQAAFWFLKRNKESVPSLGEQGLCRIKVLIQSRW